MGERGIDSLARVAISGDTRTDEEIRNEEAVKHLVRLAKQEMPDDKSTGNPLTDLARKYE